MRRPRAVLADQYGLVLEGLQHIIEPEVEVVGTARDGRHLIAVVTKLQPDVIITEASLPLLSGVEAVIRIKKQLPRIHVIFLTRHADRKHLMDALYAGASGYLIKDCPGSEVLSAIREILKGRSYITPLVTADVISTLRETARDTASPGLTDRQREIMQLVVEGHSIKEIAAILNVSAKTVEYHKYGMMRRLGLRTNTQLVQYAIEHGFSERSPDGGTSGHSQRPAQKP
jgi:DNA-binding NarL/FixJ family response regulator